MLKVKGTVYVSPLSFEDRTLLPTLIMMRKFIIMKMMTTQLTYM